MRKSDHELTQRNPNLCGRSWSPCEGHRGAAEGGRRGAAEGGRRGAAGGGRGGPSPGLSLYFFVWPGFWVEFVQSLRAFRRAVLFGLFAWWPVELLSLRLSVCSFDHGGFLRTFRGLVLCASWAPFWELEGSLEHHFEVSGLLCGWLQFGSAGGRLGTIFRSLGAILGIWGLPWASFLGLWGCSGAFGALWGLPWPPKVPKAKFFHFFPSHFGVILAPF